MHFGLCNWKRASCWTCALTLDVEHHLGLHRAYVVGGRAAILPGIGLRHLTDPQHAALNHDVSGQRPTHLTPLHRGLRVTHSLALKLHRVSYHDGLHRGTHVDHHLRQGCGTENKKNQWMIFVLNEMGRKCSTMCGKNNGPWMVNLAVSWAWPYALLALQM